MPSSIMQKNYSHQPLKKRPVVIVKEGKYQENNYLGIFTVRTFRIFISFCSGIPAIRIEIKFYLKLR